MRRQQRTSPIPLKNAARFRYEFLIPLGLFLAFLAVTLPGIAWGAPEIWHPDEVVYIAINALQGETDFDSSNFNHPHLPIYLMLGLGKILVALGQTNEGVLIAARILSAVLTGLTIVLVYFITRRMGASAPIAGLSGLLLLSMSEMSHNGRFAHNDTFVTFFITLTFFFLVQYLAGNRKGWLYAGYFGAGLAISSKYSALSVALLPAALYLWLHRHELRKQALQVVETLFIGGALTFLGYAAGTPQALLWMAYYFKRVVPALIYNSNYGRQPGSVMGILGQYAVFAEGVGLALFVLFSAAFLWGCYRLVQAYRGKTEWDGPLALLMFAILVIDLPILQSYNFPIRFFLPLMPLFAVLGAFFIRDGFELIKSRGTAVHTRLAGILLALVLTASLARSISVMLLFLNDSRIPAMAFIVSLPAGTSLEHTQYTPGIPAHHFEREHNYPVFFIKAPDQEVPLHRSYTFNEGESGLVFRQTDYLIIDSFTAAKFEDPYICEMIPAECIFFTQLNSGRTDHYQLMKEFTYRLPPFLPQIKIAFVNPEIRIYERIK
jgi:hypothetical protein